MVKTGERMSRFGLWTVYSLLLIKCTLGLLPGSDGYDSSDFSGSVEETVLKYDNNLNVTQHFKSLNDKQLRRNYDSEDDLKATYSGHSRFEQHQFHCPACQFRSVFAKASLKSIKAHVLLKLGFEYPPNQTNYPKVPEDILKSFNEKVGHGQHNRMRDSAGDQQYMSDDPSAHDRMDEVEEDIDYYQITNKIYILPNHTVNRFQRDHKEYLQFKLDERDYSNDFHAWMHIYVHGEEWLRTHHPYVPGNVVNFTIYKGVKPSITPVVGRYVGPVPGGLGRFIEFNVTDMVQEWFEDTASNKYAIVETFNSFTEKIVVTNPNGGKFTPYIEIEFRDAPKKRIKRNLSLDCEENDNETRCCRYPLTVDFEKFGWDWIIAPKRYEASYCAGECMLSFLPKYEHTHVMQLSTSAIPCCSPKKMSPIKLLYFDLSYRVIYSTIPNMIVEKCSCS
uniref:Putative transforming growth factor beta bone morphoproteintic protein n=1 Tax=Culex tarsalis TaxID=7177 RepID=A0A1Q3FPU8_CULTA